MTTQTRPANHPAPRPRELTHFAVTLTHPERDDRTFPVWAVNRDDAVLRAAQRASWQFSNFTSGAWSVALVVRVV